MIAELTKLSRKQTKTFCKSVRILNLKTSRRSESDATHFFISILFKL